MFKRLFSKKSGFTLVEIIIAFAVFAIMAAMILQMLNIVTFQRKSNADLSEMIDEQEQYLIEHTKNPFDATAGTDGTITFDFGAGGKFDVSYQMNGATETGDVDGLAYYVADKAVNTNPPDEDDDDDDDDDANSNSGSQMDRFNTRLTGTRGFEFIKVAQVKKVREESYQGKTVYVYAFDLVAKAGSSMDVSEIPYANYRLYFYTKSGAVAPIAFANYLNDANPTADLGAISSKSKISFETGAITSSPNANNVYTVSITGKNGIRVGSPFKAGSGGSSNNNNNGSSNEMKRCTQCNGLFRFVNYNWTSVDTNEGPWRQCPNAPASNPWDQCQNHLVDYTPPAQPAEPAEPADDYTGNGVKFTENKHTRIEIAFTVDPELTVDSFGANSNNGEYKANAVVGGNSTGPNIYGAFPK